MKPASNLSPIARRAVFFAAGLVFLALALAVVELCTRVVLPYRNPIRIFVKPVVSENMQRSMAPVVEFDAELSYRLRPNIRGGHLALTTFNSNSDGIRRDGELGKKPRGGVRILCLGDSCTFGFGVPTYWKEGAPSDMSERSYTVLLENQLRATYPGKSIEVINVGVPGYASSQGVISLKRNLPKYEADIVTAMFFNNDIVDPGSSGRASRPVGSQILLRKLAAGSQFVTHLIDWSNRRGGGARLEGFGSANTPLEDYITNFDTMREFCAANGAAFVVINPFNQKFPENDPWLPAHRITEFRDTLKAYVQAADLPFLDIVELTELGYPANNDLFIERVHPNYPGHQLVAKRLHDLLRPMIEQKLDGKK
jgi:lysophospholipase L1-like esterase